MSFRYRAFGLCIRSEIELPELDSTTLVGSISGVTDDLTIRIVHRDEEEEAGVRTRIAVGEVYTAPPHIGRCWIRDGSEIELEPAEGVDAGILRLFLLGTAIGVILHQRGYLVLHASSIMIGGRAVAFVGESGAGKSTLAAAFDAAGHPVIADDLGAIEPGAGGPLLCRGFRQIRLWPDSAEALGHDHTALPLLHTGGEKRWLRPALADLPDKIPLAALFILERIGGNDHHDRLITRPEAQERIIELVHHTFNARMLEEPLLAADHLRQCAAVVRSVPVYRLSLPSHLEELPTLVGRIVSIVEESSGNEFDLL